MNSREKLYKIDTKGNIRVWWMQYTEDSYRTCSGILNGAIVESGWQYPTEKNIGKINATTVSEQVKAEIDSKYEIQQYQGKYHASIDDARKGSKFIECMLADKFVPKKTTDYPYFSQPKLDGVRCLVSTDGMQTRNGKAFVSSPHIQEYLESFFEQFPDYILDGELYNHDLKSEFEKIISLARKTKPTKQDLEESRNMIQYHVYDVITPEPIGYENRIKFLQSIVSGIHPSIRVVATSVVTNFEETEAKLGNYLEAGYEGQMLRKSNMPYEHRRSKSLIKHKMFEDGEYKIVNLIEGKGSWQSYIKAVEIELPDGSTQQSGMRGNFEFARNLFEKRDQYIGTEVTIRYQNKTSDGKLRFPVAVAFWKGRRDV